MRSCPSLCSSHGVCLRGLCVCAPGWGGDDCADHRPCSPTDCSGHGVCVEGSCHCAIGYSGPGCSQRKPTGSGKGGALVIAPPADAFGKGWTAVVAGCPLRCSDHGACVRDASGAACKCASGWHGAACDVAAPCPNGCSGYGLCAHGTCLCAAGSKGFDCADLTRSPGLFSACPDDCAGAGVCREHGVCECLHGFSGANCLRADPCPLDCYGRGLCRPAIGGGAMCVCAAGWGGAACDEVVAATSAR